MVLRVMDSTQFLRRAGAPSLAYDRLTATASGKAGVVFLHGLMSDRSGTKAQVLWDHCRTKGYGYVRFDMTGHGGSEGRFEDGTISRWTADAVAVLDELTAGPQILIGSSMGGWVMLKTALARPNRVAGLIGIAAAPDFTERMWAAMSKDQRATLQSAGVVGVQSDYDTRPYPISRALIEDGRMNLLQNTSIAITVPVRLLHGQQDTSVPWETSVRLAADISGGDVEVVLSKDGDHRLSRPQDLARLCAALDDLITRTAT